MENWKPVVGFEGKYEVSDQGRVRSLDRVIVRLNRWGNYREARLLGRVLRPEVNKARGGYRYVNLYDQDGQHMRRVSVLVAAAFLGPRPPQFDVAHENGNPSDDRLENVSYKTKKANAEDRIRHGTHLEGERHPSARLKHADVLAIKKRISEGSSQSEIAKDFGICQQHVCNISIGKRWAHVR